MRFKEWLLTEDFEATSSDLTGDIFYPTNAGDYAYASNLPAEHWSLQWKWKQEKEQGRKFHNIDQEEFEKRGYVAPHSLTMPTERWRHKPDQKPNLKSVKTKHLVSYGISKNSQKANLLPQIAMVQCVSPLNKIFGDDSSGSWPKAALNQRWNKNGSISSKAKK